MPPRRSSRAPAPVATPEPEPPKKAPAKAKRAAPAKKPAPAKAAKKPVAATAAVVDTDTDSGPAPKMAKVTLKGGAKVPVDTEFGRHNSFHVYQDSTGPWDFTGNQTNIGNNNNKYYIVQLLESDSGPRYVTWTRWGRVGVKGMNKVLAEGGLEICKDAFEKKFKDKTSNHWSDRASFQHKKGKYDMVKIDYTEDAEEDQTAVAAKAPKPKEPESMLEPPIKSLMELIFDVRKMTAAVVEMKYDVRKMPLGKLTREQIRAGYESLKEIESLLKRGASYRELQDASSDFYTRVPHNFGMSRPPVINDDQLLKDKLSLIETLDDIKTAMAIIDAGAASTEAKVDTHYKSLDCGMEPIDRSTAEFKMIQTYLHNTHGTTHSSYKMEILDVFSVEKDTGFVDGSNKMLLWHGSRLTNWPGILSQGLRIAPPEAPVTGYMFGKGVYFADSSSKSANYCFANRVNNQGLMLLCEVVTGNPEKRLAAQDTLHLHLPKDKDSCLGCGRLAPDPAQTVTTDDGVIVPLGKLKPVDSPAGYSLQYNEYIVYKTSQIKFRYLLRLRFDY